MRSLASTVVPVAGLLGETAATLREDEVAYLRQLAELDDDELADLVVTADRFGDPTRSPLTAEVRFDLLDRFGMFGVRHVLSQLRAGRVQTAAEVAEELQVASGVRELRSLLAEHFLPRARTLQSRAVLAGLRVLAGQCRDVAPAHASWLAGEVERIEAGSRELGQLRLLHLAISGAARLAPDESDEVRAMVLGDGESGAPGVPGVAEGRPASADELRQAALVGVGRWRTRAEDPLADPPTREAAELVAQAYEALYARQG